MRFGLGLVWEEWASTVLSGDVGESVGGVTVVGSIGGTGTR